MSKRHPRNTPPRWIVTALGRDRPGIVAGVTKVLYQLGCNLEDSAMTRLEGEFAVMLIFSGPKSLTEAWLRRAFEPLATRVRLAVHIKPLSLAETSAPSRSTRPYAISVYGADRPGIVYRVSESLAKLGVNIVDVHTHRSGSTGRRSAASLYLMVIQAEVPPSLSLRRLDKSLEALRKTLGVEVTLRAADAAVL